eukprot:4600545-Pleurochrysis_carterae.AAC.3
MHALTSLEKRNNPTRKLACARSGDTVGLTEGGYFKEHKKCKAWIGGSGSPTPLQFTPEPWRDERSGQRSANSGGAAAGIGRRVAAAVRVLGARRASGAIRPSSMERSSHSGGSSHAPLKIAKSTCRDTRTGRVHGGSGALLRRPRRSCECPRAQQNIRSWVCGRLV